jgi:hypothetical protein
MPNNGEGTESERIDVEDGQKWRMNEPSMADPNPSTRHAFPD